MKEKQIFWSLKAMWKLGIRTGLVAFALSHASANSVINGDFEAGNSGFTSQYVYTAVAGGLATGGEAPHFAGEGKYAVGSNPQHFHPSFVSFGDHTTGHGLMMIVNGSKWKVRTCGRARSTHP